MELPQTLRSLDEAAALFGDALAQLTWQKEQPVVNCAAAKGLPTFSSTTVPGRRLRELQVHLVDLAVQGHDYSGWLDAFVDGDLPVEWPSVERRTAQAVHVVDEFGQRYTTHLTTDEDRNPLPLDRRRLLAWVLDRATIAELPTLDPWSNHSRWEHLVD